MDYQPLGQTGLRVSKLAFGGSSLGGVFRKVTEQEGIDAVHASLELGVNFIDTSPYYGITVAEQVLGKALASIPRDQYILATKVGRYHHDAFDFSAQRVLDSIDESLARLGVDHVDLIQCHDIEHVDLKQIINETLPALERARQAGKVRFIGITGLPLRIFRIVLEAAPQGAVDTVLSYCHYQLNDDALADMTPYLLSRGVGVISAAPLGMGLLSNRGTPDWHPAPMHVKQLCAKAAALCASRGEDIARLALQFAVSAPDIASTIIGSASAENMRRNIRWIDEPMDLELLADVREVLRPIHNITWTSGREENNGEWRDG